MSERQQKVNIEKNPKEKSYEEVRQWWIKHMEEKGYKLTQTERHPKKEHLVQMTFEMQLESGLEIPNVEPS